MKKQLNKKQLNRTAGGNCCPTITIDGAAYTIADYIDATDLKQMHLVEARIKFEEGMKIAVIKPINVSENTIGQKKIIRRRIIRHRENL